MGARLREALSNLGDGAANALSFTLSCIEGAALWVVAGDAIPQTLWETPPGRILRRMSGAFNMANHPYLRRVSNAVGLTSVPYRVTAEGLVVVGQEAGGPNGARSADIQVPSWGLPGSRFRLVYDMVFFLLTTYTCTWTPIRATFLPSTSHAARSMAVVDAAIDCSFLWATLIAFRFAYIDEVSKLVVTSKRQAAKRYLRSSLLWLNLLAIFPSLPLDVGFYVHGHSFPVAFLLLRLLHGVNYKSQWKSLKHLLKQRGIQVNETNTRTAILLFFMSLFASFMACIYWASSEPDGWRAIDPVLHDDLFSKYARSMHFVIQTLFTIGYGDQVIPLRSRELAVGTLWIVATAFLNGLLVANFTSVIAKQDIVNLRFRQAGDTLNRYMGIRQLPDRLRERIRSYHSFLYTKSYGISDKVLRDNLPRQVQYLMLEAEAKLLSKVPFFGRSLRTVDLVFQMTARLDRRIYTPGTTIIYQHDVTRELFIVQEGRVDLYTRKVKALTTLLQGDFFGDHQLIFGGKHLVGARASSFTCALVLTYDALMSVLALPENANIHMPEPGDSFIEADLTDKGLKDTRASYVERIRKYRKLQSTMSRVNAKVKDLMSAAEDNTKSLIIPTSSPFHIYWDVILLISTIYLIIMIPSRIDHHIATGAKTDYYTLPLDYFVDAVFIVDMILQGAFFAFKDLAGGRQMMVSDQARIYERYIKSARFIVDLLASLPYDFMGFALGNWPIMRLPHLLRVLALPRYISDLKQHLEEIKQVLLDPGLITACKMLLGTVTVAHWCSTMWSVMYYRGREPVAPVYFTFVTLATVGYGDILPTTTGQTVYVVVMCSLGASFTAYIIGNVISFVAGASPNGDNVEHKQGCVKAFMIRNGISDGLQDRIMGYFAFLEERWESIDENKVLQMELSDNLRKDVVISLTYKPVLSCDYLVKNYDSLFLHTVMTKLEYRFVPANTVVVSQHLMAQGMYFIHEGKLCIVPLVMKDNKPFMAPDLDRLSYLGPNQYFGEEALGLPDFCNPLAPNYLVKTASPCELWVLGRAVFQEMVQDRGIMPSTAETKDSPPLDAASRATTAPPVGPSLRKSKASPAPQDRPSLKGRFSLGKESSTSSKAGGEETEEEQVLERFEDDDVLADYTKGAQRDEVTKSHHPLRAHLPNIWRTIMSVVVLFNLLAIPFRIAFMIDYGFDMHFIFDYIGDILLFIDVIIRLVGSEIYPMTRREYIRSSSFYIHILTILPLELFSFIGWQFPYLGPAQAVSVLRINKVLRLRDVAQFIPLMEEILADAGHKGQKDLLHVANLILSMLICAHWYGCVFFLIASIRHQQGRNYNWADDLDILNNCTLMAASQGQCSRRPTKPIILNQYIRSIYWSISTLSTVGYGDVVPKNNVELVFAVAVFISGILVISFLISGLNDIVTQMDVTTTLFRRKYDLVKVYQDFSRLPHHLRERTETYFNNIWLYQKGISTRELRSFLPPILYGDMVREIVGSQLRGLFFVAACRDHHFTMQLASRLRLEVFVPSETVFQEGECADTVYFLYDGSITLLDEVTRATYTTLEKCVIGEGEFFSRALQPCSAQAYTSAQAALLHWSDLWALLCELGWEESFRHYLVRHESVLLKNSTGRLIQKLKGNMKSSKIGKLTESKKVDFDDPWVVSPSALYRQIWDTIAFAVCLTSLFMIPLGAGLGWEVTPPRVIIDVVTDLFLCLDIYQHSRIFAIQVDGQLIKDFRIFRPLYLRSRFGYDVISVLPLSYISYMATGWGTYYWNFRLLQITRLRSLFIYTAGPVHLVGSITGLVVPNVARRYLDIFMVVVVSIHIIACTFLLVGRMEAAAGEPSWLTCALPWGELIIQQSALFKYLSAAFWTSYTVTTVGYGTTLLVTNTERIMAMVTMLFGAVLCNAGVAAVMSATIEDLDRQAGANHIQSEATARYLEDRLGQPDVIAKVKDFFRYRNTSLHNVDETQALGWLSRGLREAILEHYNLAALKASLIFRDAPPGLLSVLARRMEPYIAMPQEVLVHKHHKNPKLFILHRGQAVRIDSSLNQEREMVAVGSILSNTETRAIKALYGPPTHRLDLTLVNWKTTNKAKVGSSLHLYAEVSCSFRRYRSSIKRGNKGVRWCDQFSIKIVEGTDRVAFQVFNYTRTEDVLIGKATLELAAPGGAIIKSKKRDSVDSQSDDDDEGDEEQGRAGGIQKKRLVEEQKAKVTVLDDGNRPVGTMEVNWQMRELREDERVPDPECDIVAQSYCHLYSINVQAVKDLEAEFERTSRPIALRLPPPKEPAVIGLSDHDAAIITRLSLGSSAPYLRNSTFAEHTMQPTVLEEPDELAGLKKVTITTTTATTTAAAGEEKTTKDSKLSLRLISRLTDPKDIYDRRPSATIENIDRPSDGNAGDSLASSIFKAVRFSHAGGSEGGGLAQVADDAMLIGRGFSGEDVDDSWLKEGNGKEDVVAYRAARFPGVCELLDGPSHGSSGKIGKRNSKARNRVAPEAEGEQEEV